MKILKPTWVEHNGFSIFSIDIHPDGTRFATGGGDNKVKLWSIAPVQMVEAEEDSNIPKLLKSMDNHYAPVNCVRWSKDGKYLASGSDDKLVMIWGMSVFGGGGLSSTFGSGTGSNSEKTFENWICVNTLRGHSADISEIAWSPDGKLLASCSFDKSIIIWDCTNNFKMIKQLSEHKGLIKGISWDPIGRYLVTQADDKSVIIWRVSDWVIESVITEPFQQSCLSFFLRSSWSPDGQTYVAANGLNNQTQTAIIVERSSWSHSFSFVGHKKPIAVAKYSPIIYKDNKKKPYCCIVLAGLDNTITLWSTSSPRPIMITKTLFDQSIQDISWLPDGMSFMCCSSDGTVGFIQLNPDEIGGVSMSISEKAALIKKSYGDAVQVGSDGVIVSSTTSGATIGSSNSLNGNSNHLSMLVENPDQLAMEDTNDLDPTSSKSSGAANGSTQHQQLQQPIQIHPTQVVKERQKETIVNGRRRITPLNIGGSSSSQPITKPTPLTIPSHIQHSHTSNNLAEQLNNNKNNEKDNNNESMDVEISTTSAPEANLSPKLSSDPNTSTTPKSSHQSLSAMLKAARQQQQLTPKDKQSSAPSSTQTTPTGNENEKILSKRRHLEIQEASTKKKTKPTVPTPSLSTPSTSSSSTTLSSKDKTTNTSDKSTTIYYDRAAFQIQPATPTSNHISKQLTYHDGSNSQITGNDSENYNTFLDITIVEQELPDSTEYFSTIRYLKNVVLWENKINGKVCATTGNKSWCAVATNEAILHIFNNNGISIMSNIVLRNQVSFLESNKSSHLLIITCDGYISVWNINQKKYEISNRELPFLLNRDKLTLKHAIITELGKPIITMSNGVSYVFTSNIGEWIKITDRLGSLSEFNSNDTNINLGILSKLQQSAKSTSMNDLLQLSNDKTSQTQLSTTFLEKQIWLATILESPTEYRHWLFTYVRHLSNNANQIRLQEICNELLGPSSVTTINNSSSSNNNNNNNNNNITNDILDILEQGSSTWNPMILGFSKRSLLKELLPIIASNRNLQRMVGQLRETLNQYSLTTKDNTLDLLFS